MGMDMVATDMVPTVTVLTDTVLMGTGMGPCGGPGKWKEMMNKFMENMGVDPEQVKKCAEEWNFKGPRGGCKGEKPWKAKRAQVVDMPKDVLNVFPGEVVMVPMEIRNGT